MKDIIMTVYYWDDAFWCFEQDYLKTSHYDVSDCSIILFDLSSFASVSEAIMEIDYYVCQQTGLI